MHPAFCFTANALELPVRQSIGIQGKPACYNWPMPEASPNKEISVKIIRDGQAEPFDHGWENSSPEERIEGVWTLTRLCLAWNNHLTDEPRLQRNITRVYHVECVC